MYIWHDPKTKTAHQTLLASVDKTIQQIVCHQYLCLNKSNQYS